MKLHTHNHAIYGYIYSKYVLWNPFIAYKVMTEDRK